MASFDSDNGMRKAAQERGLHVNKERDTRWQKGAWIVRHVITRERLQEGSRDQAAAFVADYNPGDARLYIIQAIPKVQVVAPIIDWPDVRAEADEEYLWEDLEAAQKALSDFDPNPWYVHPKPPPEPEPNPLGWHFTPREWMDARRNLYNIYLPDLTGLKAIEDAGERRRALAEAGRLRFYVDYVLEHRASWPALEAEEKAIGYEEDAIASLRSEAGRHAGENQTFRLQAADRREAKLNERKAKLAERLGVRREQRYWWPKIRDARDSLKQLQDEIVAGHHADALTDVRERLAELQKLIERTSLLALDGDLRERTRRVRQSNREKQTIERAD